MYVELIKYTLCYCEIDVGQLCYYWKRRHCWIYFTTRLLCLHLNYLFI